MGMEIASGCKGPYSHNKCHNIGFIETCEMKSPIGCRLFGAGVTRARPLETAAMALAA